MSVVSGGITLILIANGYLVSTGFELLDATLFFIPPLLVCFVMGLVLFLVTGSIMPSLRDMIFRKH